MLGLGNIFVLPGLELKLLLFSRSVMSNSAIPWTAAGQTSLSFTISQSLFKVMTFESMMPSNHLILCHPLLLLPSIFPNVRVFSSESAFHIRWPEYWSFSFSISPSNKYSGLISFRINCLDLIAVQGTLKSLLWLPWHSCTSSHGGHLHPHAFNEPLNKVKLV